MTAPASSREGFKGLNVGALRAASTGPRRPVVLAYHELSPEAPVYQYTLDCRQFEDHLRLFRLIRARSRLGDRPWVISFDDGHISNHDWALPLLEKYSCQAIFFVIAGRIGERRDAMSWSHLRELVSLGHRVEAHGWSHVFLTGCTESELRDELKRAKDTIEDRLGSQVEALSAPHGRWNARVARACKEAGYRRLYTSNPWTSRDRPVQVVGRLVMVQAMNARRLLRWLAMGRAETALCRARQSAKDSARRLLGDKLYYQLWARFSGWSGAEDYNAAPQ